ncbi:RimK family alpha-L-glutamate ligase [Candidatus Woesearchaeota archaeon]|nr:RimK family alpha-L-glutamate ligase [Candidatus Woesearchaeota archaeon]
MKAAVISLCSDSSMMIVKEMRKLFDEVDALDIRDFEVSLGDGQVFYKGEPLGEYDCIYLRGSYKYSKLLSTIATVLKEKTVMPIQPEAFVVGHDKLLTHMKLEEGKVPQPTTFLASTAGAGKKIIKQVTFPIVIKLPGGTHGKGVMIADSAESAKSMMDVLELMKQPFLIQEYIETGGEDLRAIIVGNKVVAAMKRLASPSEKRANLHSGGTAERVVLDPAIAKVAVSAAKACGCEICGVDLMQSAKGPMVLEINLSPGMQGITEVTKVDVAGEIAKYLYSAAKGTRKAKEKEVIKEELSSEHEIQGNLDFRGERILLPELVAKVTKFNESSEVTIKIKKGKLEIHDL